VRTRIGDFMFVTIEAPEPPSRRLALRIARPCLSWAFAAALCLAWLLGGLSAPPSCAAQGEPPGTKPGHAGHAAPADPEVTIFVNPTSGDTARVSLAFTGRVRHTAVAAEIERLKQSGWGIADGVSITDRAIATTSGTTTGATFGVFKAPQILNNAPQTYPYIRAFQDCGHINLLFFTGSELRPYNGVDDFQAPGLQVHRQAQEGGYWYQIAISDHAGKLAEPTAASPPAAPAGSSPGSPGAAPSTLPMMLGVCGLALAGGLIVFAAISRRSHRPVSQRRAR